MAPKLSTAVSYLIPLVAVYLLVYLPLTRHPSPEVADEEGAQCDPETVAGLTKSLLPPLDNISCPEHLYTIHILNRDPLVAYIPGFLSDSEADHLVEISLPNFAPSTIYDGSTVQIDPKIRDSEVALLPDNDTTVQCLARRSQAFQGYPNSVHIEKMRAQRYGLSGHYAHHYDWTGARRKADRVSTFMVYLMADCVGGGTNFPRLRMPSNQKEWCKWLECDDETGDGTLGSEENEVLSEGITFRPIKGSAVYWENLRVGGGGYEETWHGSLPVKEGTKIGLNIWSWLQPCHFRW